MKAFNPENAPQPAARYAQAVVHGANAERLIISGQIGVTNDGTTLDGLEAQTEQCFKNIFAVLEGAGFKREHLAKLVTYVTQPGQTGVVREVRDRMMDGHLCCSTYLQVAGLAGPAWLVEIEAEAIKE
ncbi:MAG: RidA family protein [Hyphomicrobiaceae bacterium]